MKKLHVLSFASIVLMAAMSFADEGARLKKYFDYYVGEWEVTKGNEIGKLIVRNAETGNAHLVRYSFGGNTLVELWGYDPAGKKWVGTGFDNEGGYSKTTVETPKGDEVPQAGDVIRFSVTTFTGTGKEAVRFSDHIKSKDHYVMKVDTPTADFSGEYVMKRMK